jgi:hypothetical protein
VGFVVNKVALGQFFSQYFYFPCQSSFHQLLHDHHHLIIWDWYNRPVVAALPSYLTKNNKEKTEKAAKVQQNVLEP